MNDTKKTDLDLTELATQIEALEAELVIANELAETAKDAQMRALADLSNFQRRESENKKLWSTMVVADFLKKIIPSFLELNLGAEHTTDESMKAVITKLWNNLAVVGLEQINPTPETELNTDQHEVLMVAEGQPGCVVQVLEPGWKLNGSVLIPAKVSAAQE